MKRYVLHQAHYLDGRLYSKGDVVEVDASVFPSPHMQLTAELRGGAWVEVDAPPGPMHVSAHRYGDATPR